MALIWIYFQIIGPAAERLLTEEGLWTIERTDFERASLFLLLKNPSYQDPTALEMRELISVHFTGVNEFAEWIDFANEKVILNFCVSRLKSMMMGQNGRSRRLKVNGYRNLDRPA